MENLEKIAHDGLVIVAALSGINALAISSIPIYYFVQEIKHTPKDLASLTVTAGFSALCLGVSVAGFYIAYYINKLPYK